MWKYCRGHDMMSTCFVAFPGWPPVTQACASGSLLYWIKTDILPERILNDVQQMRQKIKVDRNQDGQRGTSVAVHFGL